MAPVMSSYMIFYDQKPMELSASLVSVASSQSLVSRAPSAT